MNPTNTQRLGVLVLLAILLPTGATAQEASSEVEDSSAAFIFAYHPKPGMGPQFEEGYRRHLGWHREKGDPLAWYAWYVITGDRIGLFVDGTFGLPFAAFDARIDPAGDRADFAQTTAPYGDAAFRRVLRLLPDVSTASLLEERRPSTFIEVVHHEVRPGAAARFERLLRVAHDAAADVSGVPLYSWYALVQGGAHPTYLMMIPRESWRSYEIFRGGLEVLLARRGEADDTERLLAELAATVVDVKSEMWIYRSDLSYFPSR